MSGRFLPSLQPWGIIEDTLWIPNTIPTLRNREGSDS